MIVLGLTGSIGMGKSTAAAMLRRLGVPVHDSDVTVHQLLAPGGGAVAEIASTFPAAVHGSGAAQWVDRAQLGAMVFDNTALRRRLEQILHPKVRRAAERFLQRARRDGRGVVALDIPLLFETSGQRRVDAVIVVSAPAFLQAQRVLRRPAMSADRFAAIRDSQMPDREKRRRANYVVETGLSKHYTWCALARIVSRLRGQAGAAGIRKRRHA